MPFRSARRAGEFGTAAIEFALMSPLLMILFTGVVEIGMAAFSVFFMQSPSFLARWVVDFCPTGARASPPETTGESGSWSDVSAHAT